MERRFTLGYTEDGQRVVADVRLDGASVRAVEFTDHTVAEKPPSLGISFGVGSEMTGCWGQVPPEDRVVVRRDVRCVSTETRELIEQAWAEHHLNDMHATCDHMTEEMLNPGEDVLNEYAAANPLVPSYSLRSYYLVDNVVCPVTGYKYGHKWLAKHLPDQVLDRLTEIMREV